ncbi:MAG: sigma-54 dependent transcriptional regulator [Myxococcota bacterium]|jgi:DNA-binding NtrC family response regulator|nr:sigma-54-dependent Fis family transcriptional regulator [bacterium]MDP6074398.1 sigma-54 dependent transcriptional regulator [Myxococcota bacterium]MDP6242018.1 sigma-54 dependent transcriptional regulator [Myxococcota bacterium]MDP7073784.1 sigma-54 dependent transcriptional regulator [Myxococcota bacterium]MDP7300089.1 sigma-54 dependent transcriptional regulator [Myxococcota bacterium]
MSGSTQIEERLVGQSAAMRRLGEELRSMAPLPANVLLTGETGTGKGLAARLLHDLGLRSGAPFVHVDCAALSATLIESELFGHERGSFTSATHQYAGRFERAGSGTVFLDEIGDLEPRLQAKLLRVLEDREYERVGGTQTLRMRARVVAATSHDLYRAVGEKRFRADLFFRLSVLELAMPPLRDRLEDLPALVGYGLRRIAQRLRRTPPLPTGDLLEALGRRPWPGNVRELMNVLERLMVSDRLNVLGASSLPSLPIARSPDTGAAVLWEQPATPSAYTLSKEVAEFERREILEALERSDGNVAAAARRLRIPRGTLRHKLRKYELSGTRTTETP